MGLVQSNSAYASSGATLGVTLPNPVTAGNCLVVLIATFDNQVCPTISGVKLGSSADNFVPANAVTSGSADRGNVAIWVDPGCAGGQSNITISLAGDKGTSPACGAWVMEWSGLATSAVVDQAPAGTYKAGGSWTSNPTGTLSQPKEVAFGVVVAPGSSSITAPGSPWTELGQLSSGVLFRMAAGYQAVNSTSSLTYSGTSNGAETACCIVTLIEGFSVTVFGTTGHVTVAARPGVPAVGTAGTTGQITVTAPAGLVTLAGAWAISGVTGQIMIAAPPGNPGVGPTGTPGTITAIALPGQLKVHVVAPAPVTPPSRIAYALHSPSPARSRTTAGSRTAATAVSGPSAPASQYGAAVPGLFIPGQAQPANPGVNATQVIPWTAYGSSSQAVLQPARRGTVQHSAVVAVQAPPMATWNIYATVTVSAQMSWGIREQLSVPPNNATEIEVLPIWGLPAPGTLPQIAWNIRQNMTVQTQLATSYGHTARRTGRAVPNRRLGLRGPAQIQRSTARQAPGPPVAWRCLSRVTTTAPAAWNTRATVTRTAYTAWNLGAGGHGIVTVTAQTSWNTQALQVTATATATWETRALIAASATATWKTYQHLAITRAVTWNTLLTVWRARYTASRRRQAGPIIRHRRGGVPLRTGRADSSILQLIPGSDAAAFRWNVHAPVAATAVSTWDTLARIPATSSASWETRHTVTAASPQIAWHLNATFAASRLITWNVRNPVVKTGIITWNTLHAVTQAYTYLTKRNPLGRALRRGIPRRGAASWTQVRPAGPSCVAITSWEIRRQVTATATLRWDTYQTTSSRTATIRWDINPTITVLTQAAWRVLQQIQANTPATEHLRYDIQQHAKTTLPARGSRKHATAARAGRAAGSAFLPAGIAVPGIAWNTRQNRPSAVATATWDVIGVLAVTGPAAWNLRVQVTAQTPPIQWNVGQPVQGGMRMAAMDEWFTGE